MILCALKGLVVETPRFGSFRVQGLGCGVYKCLWASVGIGLRAWGMEETPGIKITGACFRSPQPYTLSAKP